MGKKYKGKTCAYCAVPGISSVKEHVVAREFFSSADRNKPLPCVPSCVQCNTAKSALETYVTATFLAATVHESADEHYGMIRARLAKNNKAREHVLGRAKPTLVNSNGLLRPMYQFSIDWKPLHELQKYVAKGLYYRHFGRAIRADARIVARLPSIDEAAAVLARAQPLFGQGSETAKGNLGRNTFVYSGIRSLLVPDFSMWRMSWHDGIRLYGRNVPEGGLAVFEIITFPPDGSEASTHP